MAIAVTPNRLKWMSLDSLPDLKPAKRGTCARVERGGGVVSKTNGLAECLVLENFRILTLAVSFEVDEALTGERESV